MRVTTLKIILIAAIGLMLGSGYLINSLVSNREALTSHFSHTDQLEY